MRKNLSKFFPILRVTKKVFAISSRMYNMVTLIIWAIKPIFGDLNNIY